jgi:hypothetical protein
MSGIAVTARRIGRATAYDVHFSQGEIGPGETSDVSRTLSEPNKAVL